MGSCVSGTYVVRAILRRIPRVSRLGVREQNGKRVVYDRRQRWKGQRGGDKGWYKPPKGRIHIHAYIRKFLFKFRRACVLTGEDGKRRGAKFAPRTCPLGVPRAHIHCRNRPAHLFRYPRTFSHQRPSVRRTAARGDARATNAHTYVMIPVRGHVPYGPRNRICMRNPGKEGYVRAFALRTARRPVAPSRDVCKCRNPSDGISYLLI